MSELRGKNGELIAYLDEFDNISLADKEDIKISVGSQHRIIIEKLYGPISVPNLKIVWDGNDWNIRNIISRLRKQLRLSTKGQMTCDHLHKDAPKNKLLDLRDNAVEIIYEEAREEVINEVEKIINDKYNELNIPIEKDNKDFDWRMGSLEMLLYLKEALVILRNQGQENGKVSQYSDTFNLSEKIRMIDSEASDWDIDIKDSLVIPKQDVKEFIRRLKEKIDETGGVNVEMYNRSVYLIKEIDKLAGSKLVGGENA